MLHQSLTPQSIHQILVHWDPWNLIRGLGAPEDEYDLYIPQIQKLVKANGRSKKALIEGLTKIFGEPGMPQERLVEALDGMADELVQR